MQALKPLLIFAGAYYAGYLLSQGAIDAACRNDVEVAFVHLGGYLIILLTSFASIAHAFEDLWKKRHSQPIVTSETKVETTKQSVFTEGFHEDPGTPPASTPPQTVQ